ncbi:spore cortex-lytic enzyme [Herbivorax sp. ANBcel31]|uniref:spore cortex-lytic enzyme n=1 Tax=Herbivorax sp. ANBcel31 TaxID=3069754 RepID=UPI0027B0563A|nr:spore cortex-lytic enzyme [Herbivorax sp. ANBcel31]MDQ2086054.1 spore cortex-lytic enzyme [Herbivorax sp. ANBcel31]
MKKIKALIILIIIFTIAIPLYFGRDSFITPIADRLEVGMESHKVEQVQQRLKNWGYFEGKVNGVYDKKTMLSVQDFQKTHNLEETGIAEGDTLTAMGLTTIAKWGEASAQADAVRNEQLMARAINGEARGEPYEGQVAVGAVILNRVRDASFPNTVAGVIYQPLAFTAVADGQINVPIDPDSTVIKAARDALNGWDPTNGCLYYWNPATATSDWIWSRSVVKKIGKHNFGN